MVVFLPNPKPNFGSYEDDILDMYGFIYLDPQCDYGGYLDHIT